MWGEHPTKPGKWTLKDLSLIEALRLYEDGLCKGCGMPSMHAYDPFNAGEFEYHSELTCLACEQREQDDSKPSPGEKRYVKNLMGSPTGSSTC